MRIDDRSPTRSLGTRSCSPTDTIVVDRFELDLPFMAQEIEVSILVDGEILGTESIHLTQPFTAPARLEILRFRPEERQRLIGLSENGAAITVRSDLFSPNVVPLAALRDRAASPGQPQAQIARSTWRSGSSGADGDASLRRLFASQTFQECENICDDERSACEFDYCPGPYDPQCFAWCESEYEYCVDQCPCDGFDPILVDEYTVESTIAASGRLAVICAGNIANPYNKTYYDVYDFFDRTETYRVWEDCHGDRTTELVSVVDSAVYRCNLYTGQICSNSSGFPPACVVT